MAQLKLGNVEIRNIIDKINIQTDRDYYTSTYVGKVGSSSSFTSETGKVLTFENLCPTYEESTQNNPNKFTDYKNLAEQYRSSAGTLTSESDAKLDGKYKVTKFEVEEDTNHNFRISWELTEEVTFNQTKKTFRTFGKKKSTKKKKTTKANSKVNSTSKYLLKKCGVLSTKKGGAKCVKTLQKFLQSLGYYKGYKVDGKYLKHTEKAVKQVQTKYKIKVTKANKGVWDKKTKEYFKKKYKIN